MAKNSQEYWAERARQDKVKVIKTGEQGINNLKRLLLLNLKDVESKIKDFYEKYGDTPAEYMTHKDWEKYKARLKKLAERYPDDKFLQKIAKQNVPKYQIDRLKALELDLQMQLTEATSGQEQGIYKTLNDVSKVSQATLAKRMKQTLGLTFNSIADRKMKQILMSDWSGSNWSDRLWVDRAVVGKKVTEILEQGVVQGTSLQKMARELKQATNQSFNNAFRLIRTETSFIDSQVTFEGYEQARRELGLEYYMYDAFLDNRTSAICREMDGKYFKITEKEIGVNAPPLHPNCRSTTQLVLDEDFVQVTEEKILAHRRETQKESSSSNKENNEILSKKESQSEILNMLEREKIEKISFDYWEKSPSINEIVKNVGGGDLTTGSCSSLALAYAGNRANKKVFDFRGGRSMDIFSRPSTLEKISKLSGVESYIEKAYNDYDAVNKLLRNAKKDNEYYFSTGKHATIIRKIDKGFEYLELQSNYDNGFKPLTNKVLKSRFKCQKTHTISGLKVEASSILIEISSLGKNTEFDEILKYINTKEANQKKGKQGFAK